MKEQRLHRASRVMPESPGLDSVKVARKEFGNTRALNILMEAQNYWLSMDTFRKDRERNKKYAYGKQ